MPEIQTTGPEVDELRKTVLAVRSICHERLKNVTITACLLVADSAAEIGKVKRIGDDIKAVTKDAPDVVLTVWNFWFHHATPSQRDALVDHLLCHVGYSELSGKLWINRHDFKGFREEIGRRGPWSEELQQASTQLRLWGRRDEDVDAGDEAVEHLALVGDGDTPEHDPETGEVMEALADVGDIINEPGSGVSSVTLSSGGRSVTLTAGDRGRVSNLAERLRRAEQTAAGE